MRQITNRYRAFWRSRQYVRRRFLSSVIAVVFLLTTLIGIGLQVSPAYAATADIVPNSTNTGGWALCNNAACGSAHHTYVDEGATVSTADYVNTGTGGSGGEIEEYSMTTIGNIVSATTVAVRVHAQSATNANGGTLDSLSINLRINGTLQTASTCTPAFNSWAWCNTVTYNGSWSQSDLDSMQIEVTRNRLGGGNPGNQDDDVRMATVYATVTYTAPSTYSQGSSRWFENRDNTDYNGGASWQSATGAATWDARSSLETVVFNDKLWVIGGKDDLYKNDVWSSSDGVTWTQETSAAGWSAREGHTSLVFDGRMWVLGGVDGAGRKNDVWSSSDGVTWTQETSAAGWSARYSHTALVNDNKMWIIGGFDTAGKNDVWSSSDGVTWTQETSAAGWSTRYGHTSVVFNNKLWVMGGLDGSGRRNDVWSSSDGVTWSQETSAAGWSGRSFHRSVAFDSKLWTLGGIDTLELNDVWSSSDGVTWSQETSAAGWIERILFGLVVYRNKMWVMGGANESYRNDVWQALPSASASTTALASQDTVASVTAKNGAVRLRLNIGVTDAAADKLGSRFQLQYAQQGSDSQCDTAFSGENYQAVGGAAWSQATASAGWSAREGHSSAVFNGRVWVMGGVDGSGRRNDVWSSSDGVTWTQETSAAGWSTRYGHTSVVFNNKLWVMGGLDGSGRRNDVWSSSDGVTWSQETSAAGWSIRSSHTSEVFNNKMWVMGGFGSANTNDVWSSSDGVTWSQETSAAGWSARRDHSSAVFDNRLWVIGGFDTSRKNDVWSSSDGATWVRATSAASWPVRAVHSSVSFDNRLWVIGGFDGTYENSAWASSDGVQWTQMNATAGWVARQRHATAVFDNKIVIMGGYNGSNLNDVWTGSIEVRHHDNPNTGPVSSTATVSGDPTAGGTIRPQTYQEEALFGNDQAAIAAGEYGVWDFALNVANVYDKTYCFRAVKSDYSLLTAYSAVPALNACSVPPTNYQMRHGSAFCRGSKRPFSWFAN